LLVGEEQDLVDACLKVLLQTIDKMSIATALGVGWGQRRRPWGPRVTLVGGREKLHGLFSIRKAFIDITPRKETINYKYYAKNK